MKLVRWLRVGLCRMVACLLACMALVVVSDSSIDRVGWHRALVGAWVLLLASVCWRFSLIRVVLRPGEIVRCGVWRHVVVPCAAVKRLHRESWRGGLILETRAGDEIDFAWFDGSLWDLLYNFSAVCEDAMRSHAGSTGGRAPSRGTSGLRRRFTWSIGADLPAAGAVACVVVGLFAAAGG
ncbi:hypothetical protein ACFWVC_05875 [Streptomyces sp. NPDC058691]|uniref:hypothetical protein n=1 Tax=Streptomyces sp. NPDC058691 TaxID=3346601 RepID=UPI0036500D2B